MLNSLCLWILNFPTILLTLGALYVILLCILVIKLLTSAAISKLSSHSVYLFHFRRFSAVHPSSLGWIKFRNRNMNLYSAFMPSERNTSYTFNAEGLECVLKALNVHTLLRGHQPFLRGYYENVPRKCYTVHTAPCSRDPLFAGAAFLCRREGSSFTVTARSHQVQPDWILVEKCMQAEKMLIKAFASE